MPEIVVGVDDRIARRQHAFFQASGTPGRAAFLLHDVFDVDFAAIGSALEREPAACRQLAHLGD